MKRAYLLLAPVAATPLVPLIAWNETVVGPDLHFVDSTEALSSIGLSLQIRVLDEIVRQFDSRAPSPLLEHDAEVIKKDDADCLLKVGGVLSRTSHSVVVQIEDHPQTLMKYRSNCDALRAIHPLMRDFVIRKELEETGYALRATWISPPARFPAAKNLKTDFAMPERDLAMCSKSANAHVRFMVIEKPKAQLYTIIEMLARSGHEFGFHNALDLLERLVQILKGLNMHGIVHGSVNHGQISIADRDGVETWVLSGFETAFFADEFDLNPPSKPLGPLSSHWQALGEKPGYRDDLLGALETVAYALHGSAFLQFLRSLPPRELFAFKQGGSMFVVPGLRPVTHSLGLGPIHSQMVMENLEAIVANIRSIPTPLSAPNYDAILELVEKVRTLSRAV